MPFSRKKGRPRLHKNTPDKGTAELQHKKRLGLTTEPLDLCLKRQLITPSEHTAGLHFRWLYTIRFGLPGIRALDIAHSGGRPTSSENTNWKAAREEEYKAMIRALKGQQCDRLVLDVCVLHRRPSFLKPTPEVPPTHMPHAARQELTLLTQGLRLLHAMRSGDVTGTSFALKKILHNRDKEIV